MLALQFEFADKAQPIGRQFERLESWSGGRHGGRKARRSGCRQDPDQQGDDSGDQT
jgi:hypothetical protein